MMWQKIIHLWRKCDFLGDKQVGTGSSEDSWRTTPDLHSTHRVNNHNSHEQNQTKSNEYKDKSKSRWQNMQWMQRVLFVQDFPIWPCKLRQDAWGCEEKIGVKLLNEETWWILTTLHEYTTVFELVPLYHLCIIGFIISVSHLVTWICNRLKGHL